MSYKESKERISCNNVYIKRKNSGNVDKVKFVKSSFDLPFFLSIIICSEMKKNKLTEIHILLIQVKYGY